MLDKDRLNLLFKIDFVFSPPAVRYKHDRKGGNKDARQHGKLASRNLDAT
jgi:hypothetical protein